MKCKNCGKRIRFVEGRWYHTWWVREPDHGQIPAGSAECAWRGRPGDETAFATPAARHDQVPA